MGFIGAGAILKRGRDVAGLTTAATLWLVTVIGLCFGGGQIMLGLAGSGIALVTLWTLKWAERRASLIREATLRLTIEAGGPNDADVIEALRREGIRVSSCRLSASQAGGTATLFCTLQYRAPDAQVLPPPAVVALVQQKGVSDFSWER
jgi:putative Mg2+ transporter-C (MgtC) family protein